MRQTLLMPEVVELDPAEAERVGASADDLAGLGLVIEPFGPGAVLVRETPALLGETDAAGLVRDIADDLAENGAPWPWPSGCRRSARPWPAMARCAPGGG